VGLLVLVGARRRGCSQFVADLPLVGTPADAPAAPRRGWRRHSSGFMICHRIARSPDRLGGTDQVLNELTAPRSPGVPQLPKTQREMNASALLDWRSRARVLKPIRFNGFGA